MSKRKSIPRTKRIRPSHPVPAIARSAAKSLLPPFPADPISGNPDKPVLTRTSTLRYQRSPNRVASRSIRRGGGPAWIPLAVTIPREIVEAAGFEAGMTMIVEGYKDGRIRIFPAGDMVSREDSLV